MDASYMPVGDQSPDGTPKTGDAANYGLFKNNCRSKSSPATLTTLLKGRDLGGNIRAYCAQFAGKTADEYADGIALK